MERLRSLRGEYPYRCHDCQTRFFALREPRGSNRDDAAQPEEPGERVIELADEEERD